MTINYTDNEEYRFGSFSLQLFDWMESTVRYTDVRTRLYSNSPGFSGDQTLKDKGIDVKFRLWQESTYLPQVSVGFRDFGGTGFFESEFLAFSKKWHDLDFHLGIGWGYLGSAANISNPFCEIKDSFCQRPGGFSGLGGKIDYQRFFKGQLLYMAALSTKPLAAANFKAGI
ncbi:YjbH domain-containing protein [Rheinheimera sp. MMS21-TC3]|uniref:YjbH domain-containing protein n=1 Tax=Rheinheimera sp. MMS21-TC3 TaxID=3072790 RepID=UPI0028C4610C|nr:YjbH domain-containing protein [Rheinheimera sp. MMS21-TC3]WNO59393.1 YjbH domain-containing protein [Rheinheimera sp. MMS21-TC3]